MNFEKNTDYWQFLCAIIAMGLIAYAHTMEADEQQIIINDYYFGGL